MLAQLLKNLYICTFFLYLWTDKSRSGHSDCKEVGHRKKEDPSPPTSHNNKPLPRSPKKLRQRCSTRRRSDDGGGRRGLERERKKIYINIKVPHSPLHTEMRGKKVQT